MKLIKDLGMVYAKPTSRKKTRRGLYLCHCGEEFVGNTQDVKRGRTTQCSKCGYKQASLSKTKYHSREERELYARYKSIKSRCYSTSSGAYKNYGEKGVTICQEWLDNPMSFIEWSLANGYSKELDIDKDIMSAKLNLYPPVYSPETCLWVDRKKNVQQALGIDVVIDDIKYSSIREAERQTNIKRGTKWMKQYTCPLSDSKEK